MNSINVTMAILVAVIASAYLVRLLRFTLPLPLVQVALGVVIAAVFEQGVKLNPEVFFLLFLPPLLFEGRPGFVKNSPKTTYSSELKSEF